ncbi:MAG: GNAT family N-acetyltransferase [Opitutae bacterium]|nr:GNAT family N-acetyltransferase [Opitutae bacterium]
MSNLTIRAMEREDWAETAELIHASLNYWYATKGSGPKLLGDPVNTQLHCKVNEDLDPGLCLLAVTDSGRIAACCFHHPRPTHVSLGIMACHPNYFGSGAAKLLLDRIATFAREEGKPLRLVSSAMNLDSFSLYNRWGFTPYALFQDMYLEVPVNGLDAPLIEGVSVRDGRPEDAKAMAELEFELSGIQREQDFRYLLANEAGVWHVSVVEGANGLDGFLCSITDPGCSLVGPGAARTDNQAAGLLRRVLDHEPGRKRVWLVPSEHRELVDTCYSWGARNCEMHLAQVIGEAQPLSGVIFPTFMPETW